jgi:hypothetical protein
MLRPSNLLFACLLALLLVAPAGAARKPLAVDAPTGLHGFLLRSDEPRRDEFPRTPSIAWNPVAGALRYEFQLSTSNLFREGGILYENATVTAPATAIPISLPWITGQPHSLFARVRAVLPDDVTPWSRSYGFDMRPAAATPTPIETYPGLLRWTPVEGATGYRVWFLFPDATSKQVTVKTNVIDQREWYTGHQGSSFSGKVKWRIRAERRVVGVPRNGLPVASYGPWSPIYSTTNPAFTGGPLKLLGTASDVLSTPGDQEAHRLAPAFLFSGNTGLYGGPTGLYRVYVFTDRDCLNRVWASSVVGSPAVAPRPYGATTVPAGGVSSNFNLDGATISAKAFDGEAVTANEALAPAAPWTPAFVKAPAPTTGGGETPEPAAPSFAGPSDPGAPVDFWDIDWDRGARYYWTVMPVGIRSASPLTVALSSAAAAKDKQIVVNTSGLAAGDAITIGTSPSQDNARIVSLSGSTVTLAAELVYGHAPGEAIVRASGGSVLQDLELAQEACASGRVATFGKESEPVVTAAAAPYVTGLSTKGRLVSAVRRTSQFYGTPLVAWAPALGAGAYEVQWSKARYPFRPAAASVMTYATAVTLPLRPGTWYYRVRGINYSLPTNAQPMSWSDPVELRIAKPTFRIVGEK